MRLLSTVLVAATAANAHYNFPALIAGGAQKGDWVNVRKTSHATNNGFVADVSSEAIRCDPLSASTTAQTLSVAAGSQIGFAANQAIFHPGPIQFYLAKVPDGKTAATWDGSGEVWFKIYGEQPKFGSQMTWASENTAKVYATLPKCIKSGDYLVRVEHIALHSASSKGGAQFYISCGQITVSGGGSSDGGQKIALPGGYSATDPGIMINVYASNPTSYKNPGPPTFTC